MEEALERWDILPVPPISEEADFYALEDISDADENDDDDDDDDDDLPSLARTVSTAADGVGGPSVKRTKKRSHGPKSKIAKRTFAENAGSIATDPSDHKNDAIGATTSIN